MFAIEVENINRESDIPEESIVFDMFCKGTIVVKEKMVGLLSVELKCTFYKLLFI
jgi:hypothetical protein